MAAARKKIFRIEKLHSPQSSPPGTLTSGGSLFSSAPGMETPAQSYVTDADPVTEARHREVLNSIEELKQAVADGEQKSAQIPASEEAEATGDIAGITEVDLSEARKLKTELNLAYAAIARTKQEIVSLQHAGHQGDDSGRVADELGAIIDGTEQATDNILSAAETIDQCAGDLAAALEDESQQNLACDIQDNIVKIFEACNFQDLTGQRINKVVKAFTFIEERVDRMLGIWGGIETFQGIEPEKPTVQRQHAELLNGPALDDDEGVASQADIDALFD